MRRSSSESKDLSKNPMITALINYENSFADLKMSCRMNDRLKMHLRKKAINLKL